MSRVSRIVLVLVAAIGAPIAAQAPAAPSGRWPEARAAEWYRAQPWLVGCNFTPANAINQLEMWQADTFDPARIDRELGWAEGLGFNTMRVFLHDLLWEQDADGFLKRIDQFLAIADKHKIGRCSCCSTGAGTRIPKLGQAARAEAGRAQLRLGAEPRRRAALAGPVAARRGWRTTSRASSARFERSTACSPGTSGTSRTTPTAAATGTSEPGQQAAARAGAAAEGLRLGASRQADAAADERRLARRLVDRREDVGHGSGPAREVRRDQLPQLRRGAGAREADRLADGATAGRSSAPSTWPAAPAARSTRSCRYLKKQRIAAYNWGFVAGKTQTRSTVGLVAEAVHRREPEVWFHDIFRGDGTPYRADEIDLLKKMTAAHRKAA